MEECETAVLTLSIAVARLVCGQQRERFMQVSNAQGHPGFSPQPLHFHRADSVWLLATCAAAILLTLQENELTLTTTVMPSAVVLSGSFFRSLTLEQKCFAPGVHKLL